MDKTVTAAEANRKFSELLRMVKNGRSVVVTSHGNPVARITPLANEEGVRSAARSALFERLRKQRVGQAARWTRDELYDEVK